MNGMDLAEMLAGIANGTPRLAGALCRGRAEEFDADFDGRPRAELRAVAAVCHRCPCFVDCSVWLHGLPWDRRPVGVVAGRLIRPPKEHRERQRRSGAA